MHYLHCHFGLYYPGSWRYSLSSKLTHLSSLAQLMMNDSWRAKWLVFHSPLPLTFWTLPWVILEAALNFLMCIPVLWGHILTSQNWMQTTQAVHGLSFLGWIWISSLFPICYSSLCPCKAKARFSGLFPCLFPFGSTGGAERSPFFFFPPLTGYFSEMADFPKAAVAIS